MQEAEVAILRLTEEMVMAVIRIPKSFVSIDGTLVKENGYVGVYIVN